MAFRLTAGVEWERNSSEDGEIDTRRAMLGAEFRLFPKTFNNFPQRVRFSVLREENALSGETFDSFNLDLFPSLSISDILVGGRAPYKRFLDLYSEEDLEAKSSGNNETTSALAQGSGQLLTADTVSYFYFRPFGGLQFELADDAGAKEIRDAFEDAHFRYGVSTGIGVFQQRVILSYTLTGHAPLDLGEAFVRHEFAASYSSVISTASITASYVYGEAAPTFEKQDLLKLGIGIRF